MHKVTFFPLGNADCCLIDLENGKKIMLDYACYEKTDDIPRIDLAETIREDLKACDRNNIDVVGFTHADDDHIHGASDFFYLEHATTYQNDSRIKINELWVPAAMILEDGLDDDARVIRQEARHRLIAGKGIRVFSRPEKLQQWLESKGLSLKERSHLITDAGKLVPGFDKVMDGVEFFVHSPFAAHVEDGIEDRNECSLMLHATFLHKGKETKMMIIGDSTCDTLSEIVNTTRYHGNESRLEWDIFDIPHHCSYLALNNEKGLDKTEPIEDVKWLLEQGRQGGILVSCSKKIPQNDEDVQPPHRQAANCYKDYASSISGEFRVTMEYPSSKSPKKTVIEIDNFGATLKKESASVFGVITQKPSPRAGQLK